MILKCDNSKTLEAFMQWQWLAKMELIYQVVNKVLWIAYYELSFDISYHSFEYSMEGMLPSFLRECGWLFVVFNLFT